MKIRNLLSCGLAAAALLLPTACAEEYASTSSGEKVPLRLTAGTASVTRAATNIQSTVFDAGEIINAYITASDGTVIGAPTVYTTETASGDINPLTPDVQPYFPQAADQKLNIYALYPPTVTSGTTAFAVSSDQRGTGDAAVTAEEDAGNAASRGYKASDLMWAQLTDVTRGSGTSTTTTLPFEHKMVKLIVKVVIDDPNVGNVSSVTLKGVYRRISFIPSTGLFGGTPELGSQGDIIFNSSSSNASDESACLFPPQSLQNGDFLEVTTSTGGTASFALALPSPKVFNGGNVYVVELHVGTNNLKKVATIDQWPNDYDLQVNALGAGNLQIDEISDVDLTDVSSYILNTATVPNSYEPKTLVVSSDGTPLAKGTDYAVQYFNNTGAGIGVAVVTGMEGTPYQDRTAARSFQISSDYAEFVSAANKPQARSRIYDGTTQPLVSAGQATLHGTGNGAPIRYSLSKNGNYKTSIPEVKDAGTYTVWYKVDDTDSYRGIEPESVTVTIDKAQVVVNSGNAPVPITPLVYNEQYQQLVTAGNCTVLENGNNVSVPLSYCLTENGTYSYDIPTRLNAGTYTVWYKVGDNNHRGVTVGGTEFKGSVTVSIQKAEGRVTLTPASLLFDISDRKGATKILNIDRAGDGVVSYSTDNTTDYSITLSGTKISAKRLTEKEAEGTITIEIAEGSNYKAISKQCTVELRKPVLHLSSVKSTDQKYVGYLVSTTGYVYPPTAEGVAMLNTGSGERLAGMITYVGTSNTNGGNGFVMALHDYNNGERVYWQSASGSASSFNSSLSVAKTDSPRTYYNWHLGSKEEYATAFSNSCMFTSGDYWTVLGDDNHWTSSTEHGVLSQYMWIWKKGSFSQSNDVGVAHEYKVRPLFSF